MAKKKKGTGKPAPVKKDKPTPKQPVNALLILPRGRPSIYTPELGMIICRQLAEGKSLRRICQGDEDLPAESTVRYWAIQDIDGFFAHYARAREIGLEAMADEMLDIADDGTNDWVERERRDGSTFIALDKEAVMRSALRIETRKWYMTKIVSRKLEKPSSDSLSIPGDYVVLKPDEAGPLEPIL